MTQIHETINEKAKIGEQTRPHVSEFIFWIRDPISLWMQQWVCMDKCMVIIFNKFYLTKHYIQVRILLEYQYDRKDLEHYFSKES